MIYSNEMDEAYRCEAMRLGAHGFLDVNHLAEGVRAVICGRGMSSN
jgi:hypothetical protein